MLVKDGLVDHKEADAVIAENRLRRQTVHPLVAIADSKVKSLMPPHRILTLDDLGEWLALKAGLEYFHIDPLKIDFTAVTDVMSSAYATRFGAKSEKLQALFDQMTAEGVSPEIDATVTRRRAADPDLWVIELELPDAQPLAELID